MEEFSTVYHPLRIKTYGMIGTAFDLGEGDKNFENLKTILFLKIEEGIYKAALEYFTSDIDAILNRYRNYSMKVIENLHVENSDDPDYLKNLILSGKIPPGEVAALPAYKMNPNVNKKHIDFIQMQSEVRLQLAVSTIYTCKFCGGKVVEDHHQTRSADEAKTVTVTCTVCNESYRPSY